MLRYKTETRPGLVALYDIWPGNGAGPFLQPRSPQRVHYEEPGRANDPGTVGGPVLYTHRNQQLYPNYKLYEHPALPMMPILTILRQTVCMTWP